MKVAAKDMNVPLSQIINLLPAQVYWLDTKMYFLGCNEPQAKLLGLSSAAEVVGKHMFDFQLKENAHHIREAFENSQKVIQTGKTITFEEICVFPDGKKLVFLSEKSPLFDENGEVIGILGVSFDITAKKQLEDSKDILFEHVISKLPGNVYWKNREHVYLGCNNNMVKMMQFFSPNDIIGKTLDEILTDAPEIAKAVTKEDEKIMATNSGKSYEEAGINLQRQPATYLTHKVPLHNHAGEVTGLLGLSFDISERKAAEETMRIAKEKAEMANALKIEFIRNMEHDIRTPISGLHGVVNVLFQQEENADKKEMLEVVAVGLKEFLNYVNGILSFSRIESETVPIVEKKFKLRKIIKSIEDMEMPTSLHKHIEFRVEYPSNLPAVIIGDDYRLKRVLINLVSNALKFTHQGYVTLSVKLLHQQNRQLVLQFIVEDTGIGIPREKQTYIYEKFVRGTLSNQGIYKGYGLGLYIVKQFVHELEGEIDLQSTVGKGTRFICTFPFKAALVEEAVCEEEVDDY